MLAVAIVFVAASTVSKEPVKAKGSMVEYSYCLSLYMSGLENTSFKSSDQDKGAGDFNPRPDKFCLGEYIYRRVGSTQPCGFKCLICLDSHDYVILLNPVL